MSLFKATGVLGFPALSPSYEASRLDHVHRSDRLARAIVLRHAPGFDRHEPINEENAA
jgi:hypothetical protein